MHWWLPNDELYPPIIRQIRKFVEERTSEAREQSTEDIRDIKGVFAAMKLDDGKTHIPLPPRKPQIVPEQVAVATDQSWRPGNTVGGEGNDPADAYSTGYTDGNDYWGS